MYVNEMYICKKEESYKTFDRGNNMYHENDTLWN